MFSFNSSTKAQGSIYLFYHTNLIIFVNATHIFAQYSSYRDALESGS